MTRLLRDRDPKKLHLITCRTRGAKLWFVPSKDINELFGGVIARYQERYEIELFAYAVLGNHYHQLARAPKQNLARYAEDVNKQIALRIDRYYSRTGTLWGRRYADQITITEMDEEEGWLYATTNPVKHGLVAHPRLWPGLSSWNQCLTGKDRNFAFTHWESFNRARRKAPPGTAVKLSDHQTWHTLKVTPLPSYAHLSYEERNNILVPLAEERTDALIAQRTKEGKGFLGRKKILAQVPGSFPKEVSRSPQPSCYSKSPEARKLYKQEQR
ncbi:MAG TPA: transposase, partial [Oligoflexia bacterium]|nr:transposase [Oligoflexia bacterium]